MMPYYETRIEEELIKEGRLKVTRGKRDYDFLEESMDHYYIFVSDCLMEWLWSADGLENTSNWARNYITVYKNYFDISPDTRRLFVQIRKTISESNLFMLDTMKELLPIFEKRQYINEGRRILEIYREKIESSHDRYRKKMINTMSKLITIAEYQQLLTYLKLSD